ncbi:hypothetical protein [Acanthopleuribacter pedis]|uniref:Uncharacterized protein n=1 Tax=Acanthopleuribacter pedis TaxID=442870 RepID=A0A8J7U6L4_9BACT|nr:hypothetical protein [Acanthopleuribacter pedis]MBO1322049.1 hypothetical protein [Acanthopleuribacter pedis]
MSIAVVVLFSILFIVANLLAFSAHQQEHHPEHPTQRVVLPMDPTAFETAETDEHARLERPPETVVRPMVPKPRPLPEYPHQRPAA